MKNAGSVTLVARWSLLGSQPHAGMLLATAHGFTVYRVLDVTKIGKVRAGGYRYRLRCARMTKSEVPEGIPIHIWKWDRRERSR